MPRSEKPNRAFAVTSTSGSKPMVAKMGAAGPDPTVGLALWAAMQIEQEEDSVRVGWRWVDSTAAANNISETQNHADHFFQLRINLPNRFSCFGVRLISTYKGYLNRRNLRQVTIDIYGHRNESWPRNAWPLRRERLEHSGRALA